MVDTCYQRLHQNGDLVYLEVGAGWAGFDPEETLVLDETVGGGLAASVRF